MNHAKDKSPVPLPDALNEDLVISSPKRDGLGSSHIVHIHMDPILCNSVASTSFCKTHPNYSDNHSITISSDVSLPSVDVNSSCQDQSLAEFSRLDSSAPCSDSTCDDSEEDRPGSFDYMPKQKGHVRIAHASNPSYDEEVKLDSSTASSVIESPRSDDGHVAEKADSTVAVKDTSRKHKHTCWDYMPHCGQQSDDDDEDTNDEEEDGRDRGLGGATSGGSLSSSFPRTAAKEVDECVSYNLKPLNGPSVGQVNGPSVGQVNGPSTGQNHQLITPLSYSLYQDRWMSEDNKEKDKKRSRSKDDADKPEVSGQVDVNGNPKLLDPANYLQMRQWPRNKIDSTASGSLSSYTPLTISHSHASSGADPNAFDRKKERRRMKLERLKGTPAEEIKGHRKFNDIKEILAFVEGTNASKGENKSAKKKQERSRKKDHHLDGPHALEDLAGGEDAPNKEESFVVTTSVQSMPRAMGNSFRRSFDENISKSLSEDEDVDKNNGEFHDCLNTLPAEYATPNRELQQKLNGSWVNTEKTIPKDADNINSFSAEDNKTDKHLADGLGASKKSAKTKTKKDKQESTSNNNGHLHSKSNMVKRKDSSDIKDSFLLTSVSSVEGLKPETVSVKESLLEMKREDSFTEVKKRKKRPGVKEVNAIFTGHFSKSYNNTHSSGGAPHHKFRHRTSTPPPPPPVTLTTAVSGGGFLPAGSQAHILRDLSPSAFPVLSGQSPALNLRPEARRNSCGDLNSDSLDSKTYDSDRESAKSLPAAHGAKATGDILPVYPVSYARIAAAPRKNDNTCNLSLESSVASIPQNSSVSCSISHAPGNHTNSVLPQPSSSPAVTPERKPTVWKGSPRERRHSIGSSPKDKIEEGKPSVTEKNRQCGSQEVLSKSTVSSASKASKHATTSSSVVKQVHSHENSSSLLTHTNLPQETIEMTMKVTSNLTHMCTAAETNPSSQNIGNTHSAASDTGSTEYAISNTLCGAQNSLPTAALQPITSSQSNQASADKADRELGIRKSTPEDSAKSTSASGAPLQTLSSAESTSKTLIDKSKQNCYIDAVRKNQKKSVIFLDKRFDSSPFQNLGITFGFDSSFESRCDTASQPTSHQPQPPFPSQHQSLPAEVASSSLPSSSSPPSSSQSYPQHFPAPAVSQGHPHIPPAAHVAAAATNSLLFTSSPPAQSSDNSSHVPKGPHIHGPCNGLIFPSGPARRASGDQNPLASDNSSGSSSVRVRSNYSVNYQEISSSGRTSSSELKSGDMDNLHVTSGIHKEVASAAAPAGHQLNTSLPHTVITNKPVASGHLNPAEATSPHSGSADVDRENSASGTLSMPSAQDRLESAPQQLQGDLEATELVLREGGQGPSALTKVKAVDTTVPSSTTTATALPPVETASQQQKQDLSEPPPAQALAIPVVYGLKIKSGTGCGKLLFVPPNMSKKSRGNSEEISSFLSRRWLEEVTQKRGPETFITLSNN